MNRFQFTKVHVNALSACCILGGIVIGLIVVGEYCSAGALGGVIGMVATTFAEKDENGNGHN